MPGMGTAVMLDVLLQSSPSDAENRGSIYLTITANFWPRATSRTVEPTQRTVADFFIQVRRAH